MSGSGGIGLPVRINRGRQGGFTLIELIVVLLIISVLAGSVAPALFRPPPVTTGMEEAVNRFDTLFRLARDSAVRTARPVTVVLDSISGLLWLEEPGTPSDASSSASTGPGGIPDSGVVARVEGAFGGGSTLGQGLAAPGAVMQAPAGAQAFALPEGIRIDYLLPRTLFTFTPGGTAIGDSLRLVSMTGQNCLITVDTWNGHVRVY